jgi:hypothetical protein
MIVRRLCARHTNNAQNKRRKKTQKREKNKTKGTLNFVIFIKDFFAIFGNEKFLN